MTRSTASERVPLVLVGSGFVLYAVADVAFALLSADGTFTFGSPIDVGWVGGYLMIALAARHRAASGSPVADERAQGSAILGTTVTFCLFLAAALIRVVQSSTGFTWAPNALWVVVLLAVVARQILVVADNESLLHGLEAAGRGAHVPAPCARRGARPDASSPWRTASTASTPTAA